LGVWPAIRFSRRELDRDPAGKRFRIQLGDFGSQPVLEDADVDFLQAVVGADGQVQPVGDNLGRLQRSPQWTGIDRIHALRGQRFGDRFALPASQVGQRHIQMALDAALGVVHALAVTHTIEVHGDPLRPFRAIARQQMVDVAQRLTALKKRDSPRMAWRYHG